MSDPVGKPHAEATQERFDSAHEQGLAEKVLIVKGAVATLGHAYYGDAAGMERICEILLSIGRKERPAEDVSVGLDVERIGTE